MPHVNLQSIDLMGMALCVVVLIARGLYHSKRKNAAGCTIIRARNSEVNGIRTLAATIGGGGFTFCIVNDSDTPHDALLRAPAIGHRPDGRRYHYAPGDRSVDGNGFPVPKETIKQAGLVEGLPLELPARSVVLLTTMEAQ